VWDLTEQYPFARPALERRDIQGDRLRFSPDGRWVAAANSQVVGGSVAWLFKIAERIEDWVAVKVPISGDNREGDFLDFSAGSEWFIYHARVGISGSVNVLWRLEPTGSWHGRHHPPGSERVFSRSTHASFRGEMTDPRGERGKGDRRRRRNICEMAGQLSTTRKLPPTRPSRLSVPCWPVLWGQGAKTQLWLSNRDCM
jgi:hypothetical protein